MTKAIPRGWFYLLFALSGFAGLIYESIWSHYLKLMLGHAAYAQTLVLMIFMGGMAIGSWLTGRISQRVAKPLMWYAAVEGLLGVAALMFDRLFRLVQAWLFDSVIVDMDSGFMIDLAKWGTAALLTLPQAIMLGATFPLMSAGLLRMHSNTLGSSLSWLYFTNSLGAAIGVLASGFYLIGKVGLPGTIMTAGLVNFFLAGMVYWFQRSSSPSPVLAPDGASANKGLSAAVPAMLLTAFLTGAASFMYEIGWIRMLSLVLGSATHSFELMLSAFILGLALGSFYIRKHIDSSKSPLHMLGWIQVIMALLALVSLPLYMQTFDAMGAVYRALTPTFAGYVGFTLFSHIVCLALMLPVTFCAGMTLPLITAALLRAGHGESSIGKVYAANTLGAIAGVLLAVHVVMPLLGLRLVVVIGALVDLALGAWLLMRAPGLSARWPRLAFAGALLLAAGLGLFTQLDPAKTASGVFRHGRVEALGESLLHRDGKTATVDVRRMDGGHISIATNGKVDAGMSPDKISADDYTMILLSAIPMAMLPEAKDVGVIGLGSGRSTHVLLSNSRLERVDTVEIEPAIVEGARLFGEPVGRAFNDPRSHITIEDAKTYFARNRRQYDIIVSEPSNPWVSGVATLFSTEFYGQVKRYVRPNGLFVQWVHLYEIDAELVSTIFNGLGAHFQDYKLYFTNDADMMIVASLDRPVPPINEWVFQEPNLAPLLKWVSVESLVDLEQRLVGSKKSLAPFFLSFGTPANSDYFPILDQGAAERRFRRYSALNLAGIHSYSARLEGRGLTGLPLAAEDFALNPMFRQAHFLGQFYQQEPKARRLRQEMEPGLISMLDDLQLGRNGCDAISIEHNWLPAVKALVRIYGPYLDAATGARIVAEAKASPCLTILSPEARAWLDLLQVQTARDWNGIVPMVEQLLKAAGPKSQDAEFLLAEGLLAAFKRGGLTEVKRFAEPFKDYPRSSPQVRYLLANIG